ncbi:Rv3235 family protein [Streptomyces albiflavescens]|nr:Rv3235 family protein [Streptomyces albiflavescens]
MNKVMTRTKRHPGARPPGRQDTRRPGGAPPRTPGAGAPRRTPGGTPPSAPPGAGAPRPTPPGAGASRPTPPGAGASRPTPPGARAPQPAPPGAGASLEAPAAALLTTPARGPLRPAQGDSPARGDTAPSPFPGGGAAPVTAPADVPRRPTPQPRPTDLFADRLLAVLSGRRPVHCMLRHTAGRAYDELAWLAERGPLRARGTRPVVRDIGYYVPRPGAIEAFARIGAGEQLRAMAFRLEQGPDLRWRCTAVELGGPRMPHADDD